LAGNDKEELGESWLRSEMFRFGASGLLGDIERQLEHQATGRYSAEYRHRWRELRVGVRSLEDLLLETFARFFLRFESSKF